MKYLRVETKNYGPIPALVDDEDYDRLYNLNWYLANTGYAVRTREDGQGGCILLHHDILDKGSNGEVVDHIDQDKLNNQKCNLRHVSRSINAQNKVRPVKGYRGVSKRKTGYYVRLKKDGVTIYMKMHKDEIEAAKDYDVQAKLIFGENAATNF